MSLRDDRQFVDAAHDHDGTRYERLVDDARVVEVVARASTIADRALRSARGRRLAR
jgi:hypothetical protein